MTDQTYSLRQPKTSASGKGASGEISSGSSVDAAGQPRPKGDAAETAASAKALPKARVPSKMVPTSDERSTTQHGSEREQEPASVVTDPITRGNPKPSQGAASTALELGVSKIAFSRNSVGS